MGSQRGPASPAEKCDFYGISSLSSLSQGSAVVPVPGCREHQAKHQAIKQAQLVENSTLDCPLHTFSLLLKRDPARQKSDQDLAVRVVSRISSDKSTIFIYFCYTQCISGFGAPL